MLSGSGNQIGPFLDSSETLRLQGIELDVKGFRELPKELRLGIAMKNLATPSRFPTSWDFMKRATVSEAVSTLKQYAAEWPTSNLDYSRRLAEHRRERIKEDFKRKGRR
jgi:hypothetical protein